LYNNSDIIQLKSKLGINTIVNSVNTLSVQCRGKDGSGSFNKSVSKSLSAALFEGEDNLLSKGIILLSTGLVTINGICPN
jgi:hypothetical protein